MDLPRLEARILVVDDEPAVRQGVRRVLSGCGAEVGMAEDGLACLRELDAADYDVALVDLMMPGLSGMEVLERVLADRRGVVPVVMTAHSSIETAVEAMRRGAFDFLPKPFSPQDLTLRVERALMWRRIRADAERRLLELSTDRSQLRTIVSSLTDGVIVVNVEHHVVLCNAAAAKHLGLRRYPVAPTPLEEVVEDEALQALIRSAAEQKDGQYSSLSRTIVRGDRSYMATVARVESERGAFLGTATVLRDVTELMSLERAKAQFMSMVAHELNAPLAVVQGYVNLLQREGEVPADEVPRIIGRMGERVEGMLQLVRDLLELCRADALPVRRIEALDLASIIAEVTESCRPLAERANVTVSVRAAQCPPLHADRSDVVRMVANLVTNAIKYNRQGGTVSIELWHADGETRIAVADTGLGIPADALPKLGTEFFRVKSRDRSGIAGTGLGLALAKRSLEPYHGKLEIASVEGEGSTFTLVFPTSS